jgi:hypothetical protein
MQATAVTPQATTVAPATSNSKDDSNIMTAHNSRNESDNRTANTVWMTAKADVLLKSEMTATASWRSSAVGPPEQIVDKPATFSRDTSNSSRNSQ